MSDSNSDATIAGLVLVVAFAWGGGCVAGEESGSPEDRAESRSSSAESRARQLGAERGSPFDFEEMREEASSEAVRRRVRECARGGAQACYRLGVSYHGGDGVPRDNPLSNDLIDHACEQGSTRACYDMGVRYFQEIEVEQRLRRARSYFEEACGEGMKEGCHMLARMSKRGLGGPRDVPRARRLYRRACDLGAREDCERLGAPERDAAGRWETGLPADAGDRLVRAARKCDSGLMSGCTRLARAYETGTTVPEDFVRAEHLYRIACDWGHLAACSTFRRMQGTADRFETSRP